jgi:hypothetical protein
MANEEDKLEIKFTGDASGVEGASESAAKAVDKVAIATENLQVALRRLGAVLGPAFEPFAKYNQLIADYKRLMDEGKASALEFAKGQAQATTLLQRAIYENRALLGGDSRKEAQNAANDASQAASMIVNEKKAAAEEAVAVAQRAGEVEAQVARQVAEVKKTAAREAAAAQKREAESAAEAVAAAEAKPAKGRKKTTKKAAVADEEADVVGGVTSSVDSLDQALRRLKASIDPAFEPMERYNATMRDANKLLRDGAISADEFTRAQEQAQKLMQRQVAANQGVMSRPTPQQEDSAKQEAAQAKLAAKEREEAARIATQTAVMYWRYEAEQAREALQQEKEEIRAYAQFVKEQRRAVSEDASLAARAQTNAQREAWQDAAYAGSAQVRLEVEERRAAEKAQKDAIRAVAQDAAAAARAQVDIEKEAKREATAAAKAASEAARAASRERIDDARTAAASLRQYEQETKQDASTAGRAQVNIEAQARRDQAMAERELNRVQRERGETTEQVRREDQRQNEVLEQLRQRMDAGYAAQSRYNKIMQEANLLLRNGKIATEEHSRIQKMAENERQANARSLGRNNYMNVQIGYQLQDVVASYAASINPVVIFAEQAGQLAGAMMYAEGALGRVATFMSGPWGAAIIGATMVLGFFIESLDNENKKNLDLAKSIDDVTRAEAIRGATYADVAEEVNKAYQKERGKVISPQEKRREETQTSELETNRVLKERNKLIAERADLEEKLKGEGGDPFSGMIALGFQARLALINQYLRQMREDIKAATQLGAFQKMADELDKVKASTDAAARAMQDWHRAIDIARETFITDMAAAGDNVSAKLAAEEKLHKNILQAQEQKVRNETKYGAILSGNAASFKMPLQGAPITTPFGWTDKENKPVLNINPGNEGLDRSKQRADIEANPELKEKILSILANEQGGGGVSAMTKVGETLANRTDMLSQRVAQQARWTSEGGYYEGFTPTLAPGKRRDAALEAYENVWGKNSNTSNFGTDNASEGGTYTNDRGERVQRHFATGRINSGMFIQTALPENGEYFMRPGNATDRAGRPLASGGGEGGLYDQWLKRIKDTEDKITVRKPEPQFGDRYNEGVTQKGQRYQDLEASQMGIVRHVDPEGKEGEGKKIVIDFGGGTKATYSDLGETNVKMGQVVRPGDKIGKANEVGTINYKVEVNGKAVDPTTGIFPAKPTEIQTEAAKKDLEDYEGRIKRLQSQAAEKNDYQVELALQDELKKHKQKYYEDDSREMQEVATKRAEIEKKLTQQQLLEYNKLSEARQQKEKTEEGSKSGTQMTAIEAARARVQQMSQTGQLQIGEEPAMMKKVLQEEIAERERSENAQTEITLRGIRERQAAEGLTPEQKAQLHKQEEDEMSRHQSKLVELHNQASTQMLQNTISSQNEILGQMKGVVDTFTGGISSAFRGLWTKTLTVKQALVQIADQLVYKFFDMGMQMLSKWIMSQLAQLAIFKGTEAAKTAVAVAGETARTGAVTTGATSRLAVETSSLAASKSVSLANATTDITAAAARGGANAVAAASATPIIGPAMAPAEGAGIFASIMGFLGLASAEGGWGSVPADGMLAQLHKNEMVLPAKYANPLRDALVTTKNSDSMFMNANAAATQTRTSNSSHAVFNYQPSHSHSNMDLMEALSRDAGSFRKWFKNEVRNGSFSAAGAR